MVKVEFVEEGHTYKSWPSESSLDGDELDRTRWKYGRTSQPLKLSRVINGMRFVRWNPSAWMEKLSYHWFNVSNYDSPGMLCGNCLSDSFKIQVGTYLNSSRATCTRCGYKATMEKSETLLNDEIPSANLYGQSWVRDTPTGNIPLP